MINTQKRIIICSVIFIMVAMVAACNSGRTESMVGVAAVYAGNWHTLAIADDGSLWAWGSNTFGQFGDGTTAGSYRPVKILNDVVTVSVGSNHTMAIRGDGSLWAWGSNRHGQLGDGTTTDRLSPVEIMDDVVAVSAAGAYTLAIRGDGSLWACAQFI